MAMHPTDQEEADTLADLVARTSRPQDFPAISIDAQLELLRQRDRYQASAKQPKTEGKCWTCEFEGEVSLVQRLFHEEGRCSA